MALKLDRRNTSALGRWWWTVDRPAFVALMILVSIGMILVMAGSPPVARRIGLPDLYFVTQHEIWLVFSIAVMIACSMFDSYQVRRLALLGLLGSFFLMLLLPFIGFENKGAVRWIRIPGGSIQPSEFMKPCFAVVLGWIFSMRFKVPQFPSFRIAIGVYLLAAGLLIIQPDFGMTVTVTGMFGVQFFLAGMPILWVLVLALMGVGGIIAAYQLLPHVAKRIDGFLNPSSDDNYQVQKSLEAFKSGGFFGRGPGEGEVKLHIPDSHTDFIFSVAGEEFGLIFCLMIVALFAFMVLRGLMRLRKEEDMFAIIAVAGLMTQFAIQAIVNMGVAVNMLPAKGMTLPFLSYGGSSMVAMAGGMGFMLALTKKRYGSKAGNHFASTRRRAMVVHEE